MNSLAWFYSVFFLFVASMSSAAGAVTLRAECYEADQTGASIHGVDTTREIEIGSVSKVFTSFWALSVDGPKFRFETKVYAFPLANDEWDIHLSGSRDPNFGKANLQFIVAKLNALGINNVRALTFDEDFKYIALPDEESTAVAFLHTFDPQPGMVVQRLRSSISTISSGYSSLRSEMSRLGVSLPRHIDIQVADIELMPREVVEKEVSSVSSYRLFSYHSVPLISALKEMNRISNNYAANNIFESLGGRDAFGPFITKSLGLTNHDVLMFNGSGDRYDESPSEGNYNKATCQAILQAVHGLRSLLNKEGGLSLQSTLAVIGDDSKSTVNIYNNELFDGAVTAKTGTVDPSLALAGLASTKDGSILFASIYGPADTLGERQKDRNGIHNFLADLLTKEGGPKDLNYTPPKAFFSLDAHSDLVELQP